MNRMRKLGYFILLLFVLPGCLVGPKYQRPGMPSPAAYNAMNAAIDTTDSVINLKWFNFFGDAVLKSLVDSAIRNNYDLKIAVSRLEQSQEIYGITKAALWPSVGYNAGASRDFTPSPATSGFSFGAGFTWELDLWGKIRHGKRAAMNEVLASEEGRKAVQSALVANVATAYFQLRDFDNRLKISEATYNVRLNSYNILSERYQKGYISNWDLLQAEQILHDAEASIAFYQRQRALTEHLLCVLTAVTPATVARGIEIESQPQPPVIPSGLPSTILEHRPDVKGAEYRYISEVERIGIFQAQRFPSVSLTGFLGFASTELSSLVTSDAFASGVAGSLLGPIFEFGRNKKRVSVQRKAAEIAAYDYQQSYLIALREVEDALVSVETLTKESEARKKQSEAARQVLTLSEARYDNGFTSYLELLDAQRTLFETELQASATRQQQLNAYVELYRALGGGW